MCMITEEYRKEKLKEYADAARVFADIINDEGCNSTAFLLFKLLTDVTEKLEKIDEKLNGINTNITFLSSYISIRAANE